MDVYSKPTADTHNRAAGAKSPNWGAALLSPLRTHSSSAPPALLSPSVTGSVVGEGGASELEQVYLLEQAGPRQPPKGFAAPAVPGPPLSPPPPVPLPPSTIQMQMTLLFSPLSRRFSSRRLAIILHCSTQGQNPSFVQSTLIYGTHAESGHAAGTKAQVFQSGRAGRAGERIPAPSLFEGSRYKSFTRTWRSQLQPEH